jgi:hypothetical protein
MSYFHTGTRTIIGAEAFHCPVRDGKEWDHLAMVIRHNFLPCSSKELQNQFIESCQLAAWAAAGIFDCVQPWHNSPDRDHRRMSSALVADQSYRVKPHEQLVSVSLTHYCASTPDLSTSWSRTTLQGARGPGRSHLETSFPLRCFQRLSLPHLATLRCHWRDNRYTRGASTPVLSY